MYICKSTFRYNCKLYYKSSKAELVSKADSTRIIHQRSVDFKYSISCIWIMLCEYLDLILLKYYTA